MTDLSALAPKTVAIEVVIPAYGVGDKARSEVIEIRMLSYHRWHEIGAMVVDPIMPETRFNALTHTKEPNPEDPDYRRGLYLANVKRDSLRAAAAFEAGGAVLPGDDLETKAAWLADNVDAGVLNALIIFLRRAAEKGLAQIAARADSFQPVRSPGTGNAGSEGVDAGTVVEPAGRREDDLAGVDTVSAAAD